MTRKEKAAPIALAADEQPAALAIVPSNEATAALAPGDAPQEQSAASVAEQSIESLTGTVASAVAKARAAHDHAKTAMLDTLHMHAAEFQIRLRAVEQHVDGDVLASVQRLKALL